MENLLSGFNEYRMLILKELERSDTRLNAIEDVLLVIQKDIVKLQMKSGLWGALMGAVTAASTYFLSR